MLVTSAIFVQSVGVTVPPEDQEPGSVERETVKVFALGTLTIVNVSLYPLGVAPDIAISLPTDKLWDVDVV